MRLYVDVKTQIPDLIIESITVRLKDGRKGILTWDESDISRKENGFSARYKGVYLDEEYADGKLKALEGLKVLDIEADSDWEGNDSPILLRMYFWDADDQTLLLESPLVSDDTWGKL